MREALIPSTYNRAGYKHAVTLERISGTDGYCLESENNSPIKLQTDDQWNDD
jgi:hypothetical protein